MEEGAIPAMATRTMVRKRMVVLMSQDKYEIFEAFGVMIASGVINVHAYLA